MTTTQDETDRDPSLTQLVSGILHDTEELLTQQIRLVKVEVKNDAHRFLSASIPMVVGAFACMLGAFILAFATAQLLLYIWPALAIWAAYAIVGGVLSVAGGLLVARCVNQFASIKPLDQTAAGVKENIQWKTNS